MPASQAQSDPIEPGEGDDSPRSPRRLLSAVLQLVGFALCVGLLVWVILIALKPENREQLQKLSEATAGQLFLLFALTAATITLNGIVFWALIREVKPLKILDVVAVNGIATCLSYVPFKMSLVSRIAIHNKRDKLPVATIGAWIIADAGTIVATLAPIFAVSVWRKQIDAVWVLLAIVGVLGANAALIFAGRLLEGEAGLGRIRKVLSLANMHKLADNPRFGQAHLGMTMLAKFHAIGLSMLFRLGDITVLAARFLVAAAVLDLDLSIEHAILLGSTFFVVGVMSPFGEAGLREAGTIKLAALVGIAAAGAAGGVAGGAGGGTEGSDADPIVVLTLFVSATELVVRIVAGVFSVVWLRADKLIAPKGNR
ncbi:MAG: hypothetical protein ACI89L_002529 [Phycisphaerales bacterium]